MKRCFIALGISDEARRLLAELRPELERLRRGADKIRPVSPENLHVTLKFLGPTADRQVDDVVAAIRAAARATPPPTATVQLVGLGAFPTTDRPRIVFAALGAGGREITALATALEQECAPLGFAPEGRAPHPHVTLARVEGTRPRGPLSEWIAAKAKDHFDGVVVSSLVLFESQLRPAGSLYLPLAEIPW